MVLSIQIQRQAGEVIAKCPELPGCKGTGPDEATAVARLEQVARSYLERPPPSPFATVRKRLSQPGRGAQPAIGMR